MRFALPRAGLTNYAENLFPRTLLLLLFFFQLVQFQQQT